MRKTPPQLVLLKFSNTFYLTNTQFGFIKKKVNYSKQQMTPNKTMKSLLKNSVAKSVSSVI